MAALTLSLWELERREDSADLLRDTHLARDGVARRVERMLAEHARPLRMLADEAAALPTSSPELLRAAVRQTRAFLPQAPTLVVYDRNGHLRCADGPPPLPAYSASPSSSGNGAADLAHQTRPSRIWIVPVPNPTGGAVVMRWRPDRAVAAILDAAFSRSFDVELTDAAGRRIFAAPAPSSPHHRATDIVPIEVAGQDWQLSVTPTPAFVVDDSNRATTWILIGGLGFAAMAAGAAGQTQRRRRVDLQHERGFSNALERLAAVAAAVTAKAVGGADVLRELTEAVSQLMNASRVLVMVIESPTTGGRSPPAGPPPEPQDVRMRIVASVGFEPSLIGRRRTLAELQAGRMAMLQQKPVIVGDTDDPETYPRDIHTGVLRRIGLRSAILLPLIAEGRSIGFMAIGDIVPRVHTPSELRLARLWAAQAGVTIANGVLRERERSALRAQQAVLLERERLSAATAVVYAEPTPADIVRRVAAAGPMLLSAVVCDLYLTDFTNEPPAAPTEASPSHAAPAFQTVPTPQPFPAFPAGLSGIFRGASNATANGGEMLPARQPINAVPEALARRMSAAYGPRVVGSAADGTGRCRVAVPLRLR